MGVFTGPAPRLMWVCGFILFCALLFHTTTPVSADLKEDSDLVFDNLESNSRSYNNRIAKDPSGVIESSLQEENDDDHWLFGTVNRIKRSIGGIFSKNADHHEKDDPTNKVHKAKLQKTHIDLADQHSYHPKAKVHGSKTNKHPNLVRPNRQAPQEELGQAEDDYLTGQYEDYEDNEAYYNNGDNSNGFNGFSTGRPVGDGYNDPLEDYDDEEEDLGNEDNIGDDEDQLGFGSGKDGSGQVDVDNEDTDAVVPANPRYYRLIIIMEEPYRAEFKDFDSSEFKSVADRVTRSIENVFHGYDSKGDFAATVISIEEYKNDNFKVKTTVDFESFSTLTDRDVQNFLREEIQNHRLEQVVVIPDDFQCIPFEERTPFCSEQELTCRRSKQCVSLAARCNYLFECNDHSDEEGCPTTTTTPVPTTTTTAATTTTTTTTTTSTTTTTPAPPPVTEAPFEGSGDESIDESARADDIVRCQDGYGSYHGDQRCDGTVDCSDGSDERDCPTRTCYVILVIGGLATLTNGVWWWASLIVVHRALSILYRTRIHPYCLVWAGTRYQKAFRYV